MKTFKSAVIFDMDGVIIDTDGPISGNVADGNSTDLDWTNSGIALSSIWSGFSDSLSGINKYE